MKKLIKYLPVLLLTLLCSCDALELGPVDNWSLNNYWNTEEQTVRFVRGLHYRLRSRMETFVQMGELRAGTLNGASVTSIGEAAYAIEAVNNNLSEANPVFTNWGNFYMDIYQINHAIDKITNECPFLSDEKGICILVNYMACAHSIISTCCAHGAVYPCATSPMF